jgi:hypothetical protein
MKINKSFTITKSNSFTNSNTHTFTITSTNTNTHTNIPLIEMPLCKGFAKNHCQNGFNKIWGFFGFHTANESINSSRLVMPAGENPLIK